MMEVLSIIGCTFGFLIGAGIGGFLGIWLIDRRERKKIDKLMKEFERKEFYGEEDEWKNEKS